MGNSILARGRVLRAMRAWLDVDQATVAADAGVADNTLIAAEKGRACSDRTWRLLLAWYEEQDLQWIDADADGPAMIVIHAD